MKIEGEVYKIPKNLNIKKIDINGTSIEFEEGVNMLQLEKIPSKNALNVYQKRSNERGEIMNGFGMVKLDVSCYVKLVTLLGQYGFKKL